MQSGKVFRNDIFTGVISRNNSGVYSFVYDESYLQKEGAKAISLNLSLQSEPFVSPYLFSFFANMLAEGEIKEMQCKSLRIDNEDDFSRLLKTTHENTIGSITIEEVNE